MPGPPPRLGASSSSTGAEGAPGGGGGGVKAGAKFLVADDDIYGSTNLLLLRNPIVSPMFPLLLCIYPIFETLFSMYRRRVLRSMPPSMPDGIHLHSLVYRRLMRWAVGDRSAKALTRRNSMTSPYLWMLCMVSLVPALLWWDSTPSSPGSSSPPRTPRPDAWSAA